MEITTCEAYVIGELYETRERLGKAIAALAKADEEIKALTKQLDELESELTSYRQVET